MWRLRLPAWHTLNRISCRHLSSSAKGKKDDQWLRRYAKRLHFPSQPLPPPPSSPSPPPQPPHIFLRLLLLLRPTWLLPFHKKESSFWCNCGRSSLGEFAYRHTSHFSGETLQEINVQAPLTLFPNRSVARREKDGKDDHKETKKRKKKKKGGRKEQEVETRSKKKKRNQTDTSKELTHHVTIFYPSHYRLK